MSAFALNLCSGLESAPQAETADAFAAALARDDHVGAARLAHAGALADLRAIKKKAAETEAAIERISCQLAGVAQRAEIAFAEIKQGASALLHDCQEAVTGPADRYPQGAPFRTRRRACRLGRRPARTRQD